MEVAPNLPTDLVGQIDRLTVNRRGQSPDSFMITESIVSHVAPDTGYRLEHAGFTPLEAGGEAVECAYDFPPVSDNLETPPHTRLSGTWDGGVGVETANANILGNIGTLTLDRAELHIPEAPTTPETLGYYGACLLSVGDEFRFHTNANLPVTMMNIGHSYARDYLHVEDLGGGSFLENHDRPHLHFPLDAAAGFIVLGRRAGDDYIVSAFRIPFGKAMYTPPQVLHADPYLIGRYLVIYSVTENFSNVVFRAPDGGMVDVRVGKPHERKKT